MCDECAELVCVEVLLHDVIIWECNAMQQVSYHSDQLCTSAPRNILLQPKNQAECILEGVSAAGRSVLQPWVEASNPGCSHENITVSPGQTYRFRIINGGSLAYQTVCFQDHNVTIVAADATPTDPVSFGSCVDVNAGQR